MARFHLYPVPDGHRVLKSVSIVSDTAFIAGANHYNFKAGVADTDGVDFYGTFSGATEKIEANKPLPLITDGNVALTQGASVVLDVTTSGLPADLGGTTVHVEIDNSIKDPANQIQDKVARAAVDGLADHIRSVRAGIKTISVVLPRQIDQARSRGIQHVVETGDLSITSGTFANGTATLTVVGSPNRPTMVKVDAHATFEGTLGTDILFMAISDGTTDQNPQGQHSGIGENGHVSTVFAETISQLRTYVIRFRQAAGAPLVVDHSLTLMAVEL